MPSIDELLNGLGVQDSDESEKTASAKPESEIEKQAKELGLIGKETTKQASISNDGGTMNLEDLYNEAFGEEATKTASAQEDFETDEMSKEAQGEVAGSVFAEELDARLLGHVVKMAADHAQPDSEATKDIQSGAGVIPGAQTANPQLPVQKNRHGEADDTALDTTPQHYDLKGMDGAVAKAKLESALEAGNYSGDLSHKTVNVESEMPEGGSQKTAGLKLRDLSKAQLDLLQTDFPEEMMKEAHAIVAGESEKVAELESVADECFDYGAELAMQKIAEMEEKQKEKEDEEDDEEEGEEEKTASAMGKFILEGYWNTMMEKGAEYYGDENIYIEELIKEAKYDKVMKYLKGMGAAGKKKAVDAGKAVKRQAKKGYRAALGTKAKRRLAGTAAGAGALGAGAGYMAGKKD